MPTRRDSYCVSRASELQPVSAVHVLGTLRSLPSSPGRRRLAATIAPLPEISGSRLSTENAGAPPRFSGAVAPGSQRSTSPPGGAAPTTTPLSESFEMAIVGS